ncbi:MAG: hypothetical protein HY919_01255 [Elusimicrobia bacterium]|nr:hypothetical protein [Elusimicrobiota bacterium]
MKNKLVRSSEFIVRRTAVLLILTMNYELLTMNCLYATGIGGYYESEVDIYRNSDFTWNMSLPKHYIQTRFWSNPFNGVDLYGQFAARTNESWNKKYNFELERSWAKYWQKNLEFMFLGKEERHWINSPLLNLVDTGRVVDNSLATRLDVKDVYGFKSTCIVSRDRPVRHTNGISGQDETEWYGKCFDRDTNVYIARVQKNLYKNTKTVSSFDIGTNYISKKRDLEKYIIAKDTNGAIVGLTQDETININNEVVSVDGKFIFHGVSLTSEFANSSSFGTASVIKKRDNAASCEMRDLHLGPFWLVGRYFDYGKNFRSESSSKFARTPGESADNKEFGRTGYYTEFSYLYPKKMVNLKYKRMEYKTKVDYISNNHELGTDYIVYFSSDYFKIYYNYAELYIEFVKGVKGKVGYESLKNRYGSFPGIFSEISCEDRYAFARIAARLKDKKSRLNYGERFIYGGELRLNLTDRLQSYWRMVNVQSNFLNKNWFTAFYQLRYNIGWDLETYLEYGDGWATDNLAWDIDITDTERDTTDVIKLILKLSF